MGTKFNIVLILIFVIFGIVLVMNQHDGTNNNTVLNESIVKFAGFHEIDNSGVWIKHYVGNKYYVVWDKEKVNRLAVDDVLVNYFNTTKIMGTEYNNGFMIIEVLR